MKNKILAVILSIVLLSPGWLGLSGFTLLFAFVPLLWISREAEDSRSGWWSTFGYAAATFVGWNLATIWWIGKATLIGPIAATLASTIVSMVGFMLFHTVSKHAPRVLGYVVFVSAWIACEFLYTVGDFSWPWLLLGNGFSNDIWAVQWYEYTGIFGGALWVLLSNILIFEALTATQRERVLRGAWAVAVCMLPIIASIVIFNTYEPESSGSVKVSLVQPNVDPYDDSWRGAAGDLRQEENLLDLLADVPSDSELIVMPESTLPSNYNEAILSSSLGNISTFASALPTGASLISGANTLKYYDAASRTETARQIGDSDRYYDFFNSVMLIDNVGFQDLRHKAKLVIGVETTPTWVFKVFKFLVIDLGGFVGQMGVGRTGDPFAVGDHSVGAAICYEGLYGNFYGEFARGGAEMMTVVSNDGWWGDTPGYNHLYTITALRAVEHRRAIARSANTGISGFVDVRGVSHETMGWWERGVLTSEVELNSKLTVYTIYGDYIARVMCFIAAVSLLYYVAYRARKKHYLV